jgi:hypothetical protein
MSSPDPLNVASFSTFSMSVSTEESASSSSPSWFFSVVETSVFFTEPSGLAKTYTVSDFSLATGALYTRFPVDAEDDESEFASWLAFSSAKAICGVIARLHNAAIAKEYPTEVVILLGLNFIF